MVSRCSMAWMALVRDWIKFYRGAASAGLFALFGIGALLVVPLMWLLHRPDHCQPLVRTLWRLLLGAMEFLRMLRVTADDFSALHGEVIVANHPSLIDVVLLTVKIPRLLYVAKSGLRHNPFLAAIVRATALPDDATLPTVAASYLQRGWNLLIFPEGTRTPLTGGVLPLHRGAAQVALRTGAALHALRIDFSYRMLAKHQSILEMGDQRVEIKIEDRGRIEFGSLDAGYHRQAKLLTNLIAAKIANSHPLAQRVRK